MSEKLKPCPFCNGKIKILYEGFRQIYPYSIEHKGCPVSIGVTFKSKDELTQWWNTRATRQVTQEDVERAIKKYLEESYEDLYESMPTDVKEIMERDMRAVLESYEANRGG